MADASAESFGPPADPATSTDPRDVVCRRLARQARKFPDLSIVPLQADHLSPRDGAFAHAIYRAAVGRWLTLARILELHLERPMALLEPKMQAVLLAGAAQLLLLDRVPAHAVLDEAVGWAKGAIRPKAGGMVNAVLRRTADLLASDRPDDRPWTGEPDAIPLPDGRTRRFTRPVLPDDPDERLADACSLPVWIVRRWSIALGRDKARDLALHSIVDPPTLINVAHAKLPVSESPFLAPHCQDSHRVFTGRRADLVSLLESRSDIWVQDPAAATAVEAAVDLAPKRIIDVCAGQGTKTRQLARIFPDAEIVAAEIDRARLETLKRVFGASRRVIVADAGTLADRWTQAADLVVLDVPCSNSGVLPRRTEARYRLGQGPLDRMVALQRQIMADSVRLVTDGGRMLYSTCSLEPEENERQAAWLARWHRMRVANCRLILPDGSPGDSPGGYHDGGFAALLER